MNYSGLLLCLVAFISLAEKPSQCHENQEELRHERLAYWGDAVKHDQNIRSTPAHIRFTADGDSSARNWHHLRAVRFYVRPVLTATQVSSVIRLQVNSINDASDDLPRETTSVDGKCRLDGEAQRGGVYVLCEHLDYPRATGFTVTTRQAIFQRELPIIQLINVEYYVDQTPMRFLKPMRISVSRYNDDEQYVHQAAHAVTDNSSETCIPVARARRFWLRAMIADHAQEYFPLEEVHLYGRFPPGSLGVLQLGYGATPRSYRSNPSGCQYATSLSPQLQLAKCYVGARAAREFYLGTLYMKVQGDLCEIRAYRLRN